MGLFKSVVKTVAKVATAPLKVVPKAIARPVVASLVGGHSATAAIAKFAPGVVGLKSNQAKAVVGVTQKMMLASGITALGGGALMSANKMPVAQPAAVDPREAYVESFLIALFRRFGMNL